MKKKNRKRRTNIKEFQRKKIGIFRKRKFYSRTYSTNMKKQNSKCPAYFD